MATNGERETLSVVMAGHVDHGKSTVIGRLLADTGSLPCGKLDQVRATCARNAKPFEYAFLLDALKDEQEQGITIDTARCFFNTDRRRYIIIDAPGHVEFLKNMITGAARAEAALIVIDAAEGIRENSKRHGYMVSMLGIKQVAVLVNKMDLAGYSEEVYRRVVDEYAAFLAPLGLVPQSFIPISAVAGLNITAAAAEMAWYGGPTVLAQLDAFTRVDRRTVLPFRLPVQGVYKFTEGGDDRRIIAGTVETGSAAVGDEVVFLPSGKRSRIAAVEEFNASPHASITAGEAAGVTLATQVYVKPGELMVRADDPPPQVGTRFRANLFWMGRAPLLPEKKYKLKLGAARTTLQLVKILNVMDASDLVQATDRRRVERHEVAECILESMRPVAYDVAGEVEFTARFVIVDEYEIAGAGVILERLDDEDSVLKEHVRAREVAWSRGVISSTERSMAYGHGATFVVITGDEPARLDALAIALESRLFRSDFKAYCLRQGNVEQGLDTDMKLAPEMRDEQVRRLGELARIMTDAGQIFITALPGADDNDVAALALLNQPHEILIIDAGGSDFTAYRPTLVLPADGAPVDQLNAICALLQRKSVILEYNI